MMNSLLFACVLVSSVVGQQEVPILDELSNTVNDVSAKTKELVDKTASDIRNKTQKMSHDVQKQVDQTSTSIGSYITDIVRDIVNFFKSLFGETNTPGQAAVAEVNAQLGSPQNSSVRYTEKAVYLSLLGIMVYWVLYGQRWQKQTAMNECYRNLDECENFL
jgi:hypothetical protein